MAELDTCLLTLLKPNSLQNYHLYSFVFTYSGHAALRVTLTKRLFNGFPCSNSGIGFRLGACVAANPKVLAKLLGY